ncbi:TOMM precursor leader peptide-binding protein [Trinickia sp. YCB016]
MIKVPAFKANLHAASISGEGALILSEDKTWALTGTPYEKIVPLIDGRRSTDEIVDALARTVDAATVYYAIGKLRDQGYVVEATPEIAPSVAAFWQAAGIEAAAAQAALREKSVALQTLGLADAAGLRAALEAMAITMAPPAHADLLIVLTDDYLRPELAAINANALSAKQPWLLVRVTGPELWLGPLFEPSHSACWACLRQRLERNRVGHGFVAQKNQLATFPLTAQSMLPATQAAASSMAATAAAQFLAGAATGLRDSMLSLRWSGFVPHTHTLVRHPHCAACGAADEPVLRTLQLRPGNANFVRDGGHRSIAPEETLKKYEHLVSPITGVVSRLEPVPLADGIAHVYMAGHNSAVKLEHVQQLKQGLRSASAGKGVSEAQAKTSALCEAIERYSGEFTGSELRRTRAFSDWTEGDAIHPRDIMFYSQRQYAERAAWNGKHSRFNNVPECLDDDALIDWTPLWSLTAQRHKYVPTQLVYYGAPAKEGDTRFYSMSCSNGNASGNTLEEAILQGFFELVERDSVALWWYNRLSRPGVDIASFGEPFLLQMQDHYRQRHQRQIWALDVTSDLGIPAFVAVSKLEGGEREQILFGLGCHLDARIALQRAFAEMNQMTGLAYAVDGVAPHAQDAELVNWLHHATVANQPYMAADSRQALKRLSDYPVQHSGEFLKDIHHCRGIVESKGMEMLVLNQTRPDVGMPVAKVVVPGLRHFWARFAPGRLYDVPVQMGWLEKPQREEELNPIPIFI